MSKAVLISIRQEWCERIINGQKTIEVRKTRPKMDTPFKCYIYCTTAQMDCTAGTYPTSRFTIRRANWTASDGHAKMTGGVRAALCTVSITGPAAKVVCKFDARRRAGGMWRKNYGTTDKS